MRIAIAIFALAAGLHAAVVSQFGRYLPLVYDGGGWKTYVTLVNPGTETASVEVTFATAKGFAEPWPGRNQTAFVEVPAGGTALVETDGDAAAFTRGFAIVAVQKGPAVGATARLVKTVEGKAAETLTVPLSAEREEKGVLPFFLDGGSSTDLVFISETRSVLIDMIFRDEAGKQILGDRLQLTEGAQQVMPLAKQYPALAGKRGSLEWFVTYPGADTYEDRTFAAVALTAQGSGPVSLLSPSARAEHQLPRSPH